MVWKRVGANKIILGGNERKMLSWGLCSTYYSVKERMLEAFADSDSLLGVDHEALANQIFRIL